jgi:hypothetical protein
VRFGNESLSKPATVFFIGLALAALLHPLSKAEPVFPLTVQLDWVENAQFAGLLVAREKGWYAEQGLDVTIVPINRTTLDTVGPVVKGHNVIGCADGMILLQARREHQPIQAFAATLQASPLGIVTLRSSGLSRVKDLAGKTIGLHAYDLTQLDIMLKANGLSLQQVKIKEIGDDLTSLAAGKIDAQVLYLWMKRSRWRRKGFNSTSFLVTPTTTAPTLRSISRGVISCRPTPQSWPNFCAPPIAAGRRPLPIQTKPRPCSSPGIFREKTRITRFVRWRK